MRIEGNALYEERVTLWRADDLDVAIGRAEAEAYEYAEIVDAEYVGFAQAYVLSDDVDDGAEVFSLMRASDLEPGAYVDWFFATGTEREGSVDEVEDPDPRRG